MRRDAWIALALGLLLLAAGLTLLAALHAAGRSGPHLLTIGVELLGGREAAIPAGLAAGLSWQSVAATTLLVEWTMLLLGFPILVLAGHRLLAFPRVAAVFEAARARAAARPGTGVLALAALTLTPFLPVGALTSVLIGEMLGLPSRRLLPALMLAELAANVVVALSAAAVVGLFPDPRVVAGAASAALLLVALASAFAGRRTRRRGDA